MIGQPNLGGAVGGAMSAPPSPLMRIQSPAALAAMEAAEAARRVASEKPLTEEQNTGLAGYIRSQLQIMQNHRESGYGWSERLLRAQRQWSGEYDPQTIRDIEAFGGSKVFARVVSAKCRGASAMLREVYLSGTRPWGVAPTPHPTLPDDITQSVDMLLDAEISTMEMMGAPVPEQLVIQRKQLLMAEAEKAARAKALKEAQQAERRLDDLLVEGGFYRALSEFLTDLPLYPFAVLKGPTVRVAPKVKWRNRRAVIEQVPKMFWLRVSPFDIWWTPGAATIEQADVIERLRLTRADLNEIMDLPGYNTKAIEYILETYRNGVTDQMLDTTYTERADSESRENPILNESGMFDCYEFHGSVQGYMLLDAGMPPKKVPDPERDYYIQAWLIADKIIKVQFSPSPRKRHPYYVTSFEKIPGTVVGNAVPDLISDIQDVANATLRALVNNLSMASGPQTVVNMDMLDTNENPDDFYPWKRWRVVNGRGNGNQKPIEFYQPDSRATELLGVYKELTNIADELSAIPRYLTGSERGGGAGRTASGLAMLMNNASKVLQTVAANIDRDVMGPMLQSLYDILMLTDSDPDAPGALRGDEAIEVKGVAVAIQRETERQRQIEMLQATANPMDAKIMGVQGRAKLLRMVAKGLGLEGEQIIPDAEQLAAMEREERAAALGAGGLPPGADPALSGAPVDGGEGGGAGGGAPPAPNLPGPGAGPGRAPTMMPRAGQRSAVMETLGRGAQGSQQGGENTRPRATGPRVNLQQQQPRPRIAA